MPPVSGGEGWTRGNKTLKIGLFAYFPSREVGCKQLSECRGGGVFSYGQLGEYVGTREYEYKGGD